MKIGTCSYCSWPLYDSDDWRHFVDENKIGHMYCWAKKEVERRNLTTKTETTTWTRYKHKSMYKGIEYDVETMIGRPIEYVLRGEKLYRIRTVRNLFYREEIHIPAFTYMPADKFLECYERVA